MTAVDLNVGGDHTPIVKTLLWRDESATQRFAATLAQVPELRHAFIELRGELGAGKTTLVRHLLQALGVTGRIKSPTYAVVEPYELPGLCIWHFDFYRFSDPREWEDAGFRDIFASPGLKLAEWADKAAGFIPTPDCVIALVVPHSDETPTAPGDEARQVTLTAYSATGRALLPP